TIPHGNSLLAQGRVPGKDQQGNGEPTITPVDALPFTINLSNNQRDDVTDERYLYDFINKDLPHGIPLGAIANPNLVLVDDIQRLKRDKKGKKSVTHWSMLHLSATPITGIDAVFTSANPNMQQEIESGNRGGILNIPFLLSNANANSF